MNKVDSKNQLSRQALDVKIMMYSFYNGIYHGQTMRGKCTGRGVFWWDSGELYFGEWEQNQLQGEGIFFFPYGGYLKGFYFKNKINGAAFLKFPNGDFYEGFWRHGKLDGKCFKYFADYDSWALCIYNNGIFQECLNKGRGRPNISDNSFLFQESDVYCVGFENKLNMTIESSYEDIQGDGVGILPFSDGGKYYGLVQNGIPHGLGILHYRDGKFDSGTFVNGLLDGIGRMNMQNGDIYEGFLSKGELNGKGFFFKKDANKWVFRQFTRNTPGDIEYRGAGFPLENIINWKSRKHLEDVFRINKSIPNDIFYIPIIQESFQKKQPLMRQPIKKKEGKENPTRNRVKSFSNANNRDYNFAADNSIFENSDYGAKSENAENKENNLIGELEDDSGAPEEFEVADMEDNMIKNLHFLQAIISQQKKQYDTKDSKAAANKRGVGNQAFLDQKKLRQRVETEKNLKGDFLTGRFYQDEDFEHGADQEMNLQFGPTLSNKELAKQLLAQTDAAILAAKREREEKTSGGQARQEDSQFESATETETLPEEYVYKNLDSASNEGDEKKQSQGQDYEGTLSSKLKAALKNLNSPSLFKEEEVADQINKNDHALDHINQSPKRKKANSLQQRKNTDRNSIMQDGDGNAVHSKTRQHNSHETPLKLRRTFSATDRSGNARENNKDDIKDNRNLPLLRKSPSYNSAANEGDASSRMASEIPIKSFGSDSEINSGHKEVIMATKGSAEIQGLNSNTNNEAETNVPSDVRGREIASSFNAFSSPQNGTDQLTEGNDQPAMKYFLRSSKGVGSIIIEDSKEEASRKDALKANTQNDVSEMHHEHEIAVPRDVREVEKAEDEPIKELSNYSYNKESEGEGLHKSQATENNEAALSGEAALRYHHRENIRSADNAKNEEEDIKQGLTQDEGDSHRINSNENQNSKTKHQDNVESISETSVNLKQKLEDQLGSPGQSIASKAVEQSDQRNLDEDSLERSNATPDNKEASIKPIKAAHLNPHENQMNKNSLNPAVDHNEETEFKPNSEKNLHSNNFDGTDNIIQISTESKLIKEDKPSGNKISSSSELANEKQHAFAHNFEEKGIQTDDIFQGMILYKQPEIHIANQTSFLDENPLKKSQTVQTSLIYNANEKLSVGVQTDLDRSPESRNMIKDDQTSHKVTEPNNQGTSKLPFKIMQSSPESNFGKDNHDPIQDHEQLQNTENELILAQNLTMNSQHDLKQPADEKEAPKFVESSNLKHSGYLNSQNDNETTIIKAAPLTNDKYQNEMHSEPNNYDQNQKRGLGNEAQIVQSAQERMLGSNARADHHDFSQRADKIPINKQTEASIEFTNASDLQASNSEETGLLPQKIKEESSNHSNEPEEFSQEKQNKSNINQMGEEDEGNLIGEEKTVKSQVEEKLNAIESNDNHLTEKLQERSMEDPKADQDQLNELGTVQLNSENNLTTHGNHGTLNFVKSGEIPIAEEAIVEASSKLGKLEFFPESNQIIKDEENQETLEERSQLIESSNSHSPVRRVDTEQSMKQQEKLLNIDPQVDKERETNEVLSNNHPRLPNLSEDLAVRESQNQLKQHQAGPQTEHSSNKWDKKAESHREKESVLENLPTELSQLPQTLPSQEKQEAEVLNNDDSKIKEVSKSDSPITAEEVGKVESQSKKNLEAESLTLNKSKSSLSKQENTDKHSDYPEAESKSIIQGLPNPEQEDKINVEKVIKYQENSANFQPINDEIIDDSEKRILNNPDESRSTGLQEQTQAKLATQDKILKELQELDQENLSRKERSPKTDALDFQKLNSSDIKTSEVFELEKPELFVSESNNLQVNAPVMTKEADTSCKTENLQENSKEGAITQPYGKLDQLNNSNVGKDTLAEARSKIDNDVTKSQNSLENLLEKAIKPQNQKEAKAEESYVVQESKHQSANTLQEKAPSFNKKEKNRSEVTFDQPNSSIQTKNNIEGMPQAGKQSNTFIEKNIVLNNPKLAENYEECEHHQTEQLIQKAANPSESQNFYQSQGELVKAAENSPNQNKQFELESPENKTVSLDFNDQQNKVEKEISLPEKYEKTSNLKDNQKSKTIEQKRENLVELIGKHPDYEDNQQASNIDEHGRMNSFSQQNFDIKSKMNEDMPLIRQKDRDHSLKKASDSGADEQLIKHDHSALEEQEEETKRIESQNEIIANQDALTDSKVLPHESSSHNPHLQEEPNLQNQIPNVDLNENHDAHVHEEHNMIHSQPEHHQLPLQEPVKLSDQINIQAENELEIWRDEEVFFSYKPIEQEFTTQATARDTTGSKNSMRGIRITALDQLAKQIKPKVQEKQQVQEERLVEEEGEMFFTIGDNIKQTNLAETLPGSNRREAFIRAELNSGEEPGLENQANEHDTLGHSNPVQITEIHPQPTQIAQDPMSKFQNRYGNYLVKYVSRDIQENEAGTSSEANSNKMTYIIPTASKFIQPNTLYAQYSRDRPPRYPQIEETKFSHDSMPRFESDDGLRHYLTPRDIGNDEVQNLQADLPSSMQTPIASNELNSRLLGNETYNSASRYKSAESMRGDKKSSQDRYAVPYSIEKRDRLAASDAFSQTEPEANNQDLWKSMGPEFLSPSKNIHRVVDPSSQTSPRGNTAQSKLYIMREDGVMYPLDDHSMVSKILLESSLRPPQEQILHRSQANQHHFVETDIERIVREISQRVFRDVPRATESHHSSRITNQRNSPNLLDSHRTRSPLLLSPKGDINKQRASPNDKKWNSLSQEAIVSKIFDKVLTKPIFKTEISPISNRNENYQKPLEEEHSISQLQAELTRPALRTHYVADKSPKGEQKAQKSITQADKKLWLKALNDDSELTDSRIESQRTPIPSQRLRETSSAKVEQQMLKQANQEGTQKSPIRTIQNNPSQGEINAFSSPDVIEDIPERERLDRPRDPNLERIEEAHEELSAERFSSYYPNPNKIDNASFSDANVSDEGFNLPRSKLIASKPIDPHRMSDVTHSRQSSEKTPAFSESYKLKPYNQIASYSGQIKSPANNRVLQEMQTPELSTMNRTNISPEYYDQSDFSERKRGDFKMTDDNNDHKFKYVPSNTKY